MEAAFSIQLCGCPFLIERFPDARRGAGVPILPIQTSTNAFACVPGMVDALKSQCQFNIG
jgi:hypothetical protein